MENITITQQVNILTEAKEDLLSGADDYVCVATWWKLRTKGFGKDFNKHDSSNAVKFIPLATFENAHLVCKKYKLKMPEMLGNGGWWERGLLKPRLAFMNWMIKELKKQL